MKTPNFWYPSDQDQAASLLPQLLSPFSALFQAGTFMRRMFAKPYRARVPVVCVGNIVAGGAGKTPTALALAHILKEHGHKPAFVTRGYGGNGKLTCVDPVRHTPDDVGDEAPLLAAVAPTWVCSNRVEAIIQAEKDASIILMDDGLQNPHIAATASFLVIDGDTGIGNGRLIPAGPLRETLATALTRVVAVIMIGAEDRHNLAAQINVPLFRAHLQPQLPFGFPRESRFVTFAGIGRPDKFHATARGIGLDITASYNFPDHYNYNTTDIDALRLKAEEQGARLLTTEKDAVRLPGDFRAEILTLPVALVFDNPGAEDKVATLCTSFPTSAA